MAITGCSSDNGWHVYAKLRHEIPNRQMAYNVIKHLILSPFLVIMMSGLEWLERTGTGNGRQGHESVFLGPIKTFDGIAYCYDLVVILSNFIKVF